MGWKSVSPAAKASLPWYLGLASCRTVVGSWDFAIKLGL